MGCSVGVDASYLIARIYLASHRRGELEQVASLSQAIFWLVIPALLLFLLLPVLLRAGVQFWFSLGLSCVATVAAYTVMIAFLSRVGIRV